MKKCHICGKPATVFLTQLANGKLSDVALCQECARKRGLFDPERLKLASQFFPKELGGHIEKLISQMLHGDEQEEEPAAEDPELLGTVFALGHDAESEGEEKSDSKRCPTCGYPLAEYRRTHKLGCASCYDAFREQLEEEEEKLRNGEESVAKKEVTEYDALTQLEQRLQAAIERENYEEAARLRDLIKQQHQP